MRLGVMVMKDSAISKETDDASIRAPAKTQYKETHDLEKSVSRETIGGRSNNNNNNNNSETASATSSHLRGDVPSLRIISRTVSEVRDGIESWRDLDLAQDQPAEDGGEKTSSPDPDDPNLVTWTGPDDPENPKNWAFSKKWGAVFIVSMFTLVSPISSSMIAPALLDIGRELDIPEGCRFDIKSPPLYSWRKFPAHTTETRFLEVEQNLVLSIFILAYALGPLM